jgi:hypothetical protein
MTSVSAMLCFIIAIYSIFQKFKSKVVSINQVSVAISYPTSFFFLDFEKWQPQSTETSASHGPTSQTTMDHTATSPLWAQE